MKEVSVVQGQRVHVRGGSPLKQLETFRAVARELSFTRAAERLRYARASVTAHIQALEKELGIAFSSGSEEGCG